MNILIVSATEKEIQPLLNLIFPEIKSPTNILKTTYKKNSIEILITGVGLVNTTFFLTDILANKEYDLVVNAGICGSYVKKHNPGDVVQVVEEQFGDLGIEDHLDFFTLFESKLMNENQFPFRERKLIMQNNPVHFLNIKPVKGISVNKVQGHEISISRMVEKFNPDVESMEGAAIFYVCLQKKVSFAEIRAVSNYVEPRNTANWNISLAIANLNKVLLEIIERKN